MYIHPFKESFFKALDFVVEDTRNFIFFCLIYYFALMFYLPGIFFGSYDVSQASIPIGLAQVFLSVIFLSWLTVALWLYLWSQTKIKNEDEHSILDSGPDSEQGFFEIKNAFKSSIWDTPTYIIFLLLYTLIVFVSASFLFLPVLYFGPVFYFLPYIAVLGLNRQGEGVLKACRRLAKGRYFSLLFFHVSYIFIQLYVFIMGGMSAADYSMILVHLGLISWVMLSIFLEAWSLFFLSLCQSYQKV